MRKLKKIKLDDFDLRLIITGLHRTLDDVPAENKVAACDIILRLIAIDISLKPGRRKKVSFEPIEHSHIRWSLLQWRNMVIDDDDPTEDIDCMIVRFSK